jgi:hypothetical protein
MAAALQAIDPLPLKETLMLIPGGLILVDNDPNCDRLRDHLGHVVRRPGKKARAAGTCCWQIGCKMREWQSNGVKHRVKPCELCGLGKGKL